MVKGRDDEVTGDDDRRLGDPGVAGRPRPGRRRFGLNAIGARPIGGGEPVVMSVVTCLQCQKVNRVAGDGTAWCVNEDVGRHVLHHPPS